MSNELPPWEGGKTSTRDRQEFAAFWNDVRLSDEEKERFRERLRPTDKLEDFIPPGFSSLEPHDETDARWDRLVAEDIHIPGWDFTEPMPTEKGTYMPLRDLYGGVFGAYIMAYPKKDGKGKYKFARNSKKGDKVPFLTHVPYHSSVKPYDTPTVWIIEGSLKAELAAFFGNGLPCLGIHGTGALPFDLDQVIKEIGATEIIIALDVEKNPDTLKMKLALLNRYEEAGYDVKIAYWDSNYKGIDDAMKAGMPIGFLDEHGLNELRQDAGQDLVFVQSSDAFYYQSDRTNFAFKHTAVRTYHGFKPSHINHLIEAGLVATVKRLGNYPGNPNRIIGDQYNLWTPPEEYPITSDEQKIIEKIKRSFVRHMKFIIPDRDERRIMYCWFKSLVVNPEKRCRWVPILYSESQQTGKTMTLDVMAKVVGRHNWGTARNEDITGRHNSQLTGRQVNLINEVYQKDRADIMNKVKEMITDDYITMEQKYIPAQTIRNITSYIMTTNEANALKIGQSDKRFCAIQCAEERRDDSYYSFMIEQFHHKLAGQAVREFLHEIYIKEFDDFSMSSPPKRTATTEMFIEAALSKGESWGIGVYDGENWPGDKSPVFALGQLKLETTSELLPKEVHMATNQTIAKWLRGAGYKIEKKDAWPKMMTSRQAKEEGKRRKVSVVTKNDIYLDRDPTYYYDLFFGDDGKYKAIEPPPQRVHPDELKAMED